MKQQLYYKRTRYSFLTVVRLWNAGLLFIQIGFFWSFNRFIDLFVQRPRMRGPQFAMPSFLSQIY